MLGSLPKDMLFIISVFKEVGGEEGYGDSHAFSKSYVLSNPRSYEKGAKWNSILVESKEELEQLVLNSTNQEVSGAQKLSYYEYKKKPIPNTDVDDSEEEEEEAQRWGDTNRPDFDELPEGVEQIWQEFDRRFPGDRRQDEKFVEDKGWNYGPQTAPIRTVASRINGIVFSDGEDDSSFVRSKFKIQIQVRIDECRNLLCYDVYEYYPTSFLQDFIKKQQTIKEIEYLEKTSLKKGKFGETLETGGFNPFGHQNYFDSDSSEDSSDNDMMDDDSKNEPYEFSNLTEKQVYFDMGNYKKFRNSRKFRVRFNLKDIVGIKVLKSSEKQGVLVLEFNSLPPKNNFGVRGILNDFSENDKWKLIGDWTPNAKASKANRHYIFGNLEEIKEMTNVLCTQFSPLKDILLENDPEKKNTLNMNNLSFSNSKTLNNLTERKYFLDPEIYLSLLPINTRQQIEKILDLEEEEKQADETLGAPNIYTTLEVKNLLKVKKIKGQNSCLKAAIQKGFIKLNDEDAENQIVFTTKCDQCNAKIKVTLEEAIDQDCYGGSDYEDGDENGAICCPECEAQAYITGFCDGKPQSTSGKFHNHCNECPGFGTCIGDYRMAHCQYCQDHWFAGNTGFPCDCGGEEDEIKYYKQKKYGINTVEIENQPFPDWTKKAEFSSEQTNLILANLLKQDRMHDSGLDSDEDDDSSEE